MSVCVRDFMYFNITSWRKTGWQQRLLSHRNGTQRRAKHLKCVLVSLCSNAIVLENRLRAFVCVVCRVVCRVRHIANTSTNSPEYITTKRVRTPNMQGWLAGCMLALASTSVSNHKCASVRARALNATQNRRVHVKWIHSGAAEDHGEHGGGGGGINAGAIMTARAFVSTANILRALAAAVEGHLVVHCVRECDTAYSIL